MLWICKRDANMEVIHLRKCVMQSETALEYLSICKSYILWLNQTLEIVFIQTIPRFEMTYFQSVFFKCIFSLHMRGGHGCFNYLYNPCSQMKVHWMGDHDTLSHKKHTPSKCKLDHTDWAPVIPAHAGYSSKLGTTVHTILIDVKKLIEKKLFRCSRTTVWRIEVI